MLFGRRPAPVPLGTAGGAGSSRAGTSPGRGTSRRADGEVEHQVGGGIHSCLSKRLLSLSTSAWGRIAPPGRVSALRDPRRGMKEGWGPAGLGPGGGGRMDRDRKRRPSRGSAKERRCGANSGRGNPPGKELGSSGHVAPSPPLKANGSACCPRPVRGARDATNLVTPGMSSIPLRARCPQRRRAAGTAAAADSLTAPALPAPALGGGSRAIRCQSRAGKLDLNWEKQKTPSQRRCRINRVLK